MASKTSKTTSMPPESEDQGGAGNAAGSAFAGLIDATGMSIDELEKRLDTAKAEFVAKYPSLSAALDTWQASGRPEPTTLRITSKVEGFRRGGMAHSRTPADHLLESFTSPDQLELIFAETMLVVELV
ncbi:hypothetical protein NKJ55_28785 [Mesorhizobium sp. M0106]|uniref:hypothetical protein n=1 Tax=Mesorhizobium sp. M0106 TaxID=2956880 RepID=UPI00333CB05C